MSNNLKLKFDKNQDYQLKAIDSIVNIFDGQEITLQGELSKGRIEGNNVFKIVFDGEHIPNKEAEDQRSFSAMFSSIKIE